MSRKHM